MHGGYAFKCLIAFFGAALPANEHQGPGVHFLDYPGAYSLMVGSSSRDIRLRSSINVAGAIEILKSWLLYGRLQQIITIRGA